MKKQRKSSGPKVLKATAHELEELKEKKKSETKNFYLLKTSEEVANKYRGVIREFVQNAGVFVVITRDKHFFHSFKSAISYTLQVEMEYLQPISTLEKAAEVVQLYAEKGLKPFVFMEHAMGGELTVSYLRYLKAAHKNVPVTILSREVSKERLFQFFEEGANSFLYKPTSVNAIIKKIAFLLKPQCEIDELIAEGRAHNEANRFDEAIAVAQSILCTYPQNAAALVILGDAKKGLALREEALSAYKTAEANATNYLEPLQKLVVFHAEEANTDEALKYLVKLDQLSPLNCNRKIKIAEMHFSQGQGGEAEKYFDNAITSAKEEAMSVVGEMTLDIAEMVADYDPQMAAKYYRKSLALVKDAKGQMAMNIYNRLGISLRKQGMWEEAIDAYLEAAKYSPKDENIQYNIALAYEEGEQFVQSSERLTNARDINPDMFKGKAAIAYKMGTIYMKAQNDREALACFEHLAQISPGYEDMNELLAQIPGGKEVLGRKTG